MEKVSVLIQLYGPTTKLVHPGFRWVSQYVRTILCLIGLFWMLFTFCSAEFESRWEAFSLELSPLVLRWVLFRTVQLCSLFVVYSLLYSPFLSLRLPMIREAQVAIIIAITKVMLQASATSEACVL